MFLFLFLFIFNCLHLIFVNTVLYALSLSKEEKSASWGVCNVNDHKEQSNWGRWKELQTKEKIRKCLDNLLEQRLRQSTVHGVMCGLYVYLQP
jgi:hypothetical protein